ncbi:uncharacterized protein LOC111242076 [Vigna radiata var. radiata]|uniref:Uncharacterized protein LOC111242076 n=1 Tax=Vigna radiata var. radiata TaxID=3916 RepID=A0A3Q0F649_VIGRR|nr:uncharacterized protein LOC111242076 [Vigna radiata var. radiata]
MVIVLWTVGTEKHVFNYNDIVKLGNDSGNSGDNLHGNLKDALYVFPCYNSNKYYVHSATYKPVKSTFTLWHSRLGYASSNVVQSVLTAIYLVINRILFVNRVFLLSHMSFHFLDQTLFTLLLYNQCLLIYEDLLLTRYYIPFLDAFSRYTWLYLIHSKSQVHLFSNCSKFFQKLKLAAN